MSMFIFYQIAKKEKFLIFTFRRKKYILSADFHKPKRFIQKTFNYCRLFLYFYIHWNSRKKNQKHKVQSEIFISEIKRLYLDARFSSSWKCIKKLYFSGKNNFNLKTKGNCNFILFCSLEILKQSSSGNNDYSNYRRWCIYIYIYIYTHHIKCRIYIVHILKI